MLTGAASDYLTGGLGSSGGVGGSIPSNTASASSAATNTIEPNSTAVQNGTFQPQLNVAFPGANITPSDSINAPSSLGFLTSPFIILGAVAALILLAVFFRR